MNTSADRIKLDISDTNLLTYGQKIKINNYVLWARNNSVEFSSNILFNVSNTNQNLEGLINFLYFISDSLETLEHWSESNDAAFHLYKLSEALQNDPSILNSDCLPFEKPAHLQLRGSLDVSYLLALVLTKPISVSQTYKLCFNRMRLWILIESYSRGLSDNYLDKLVSEFCTQLRLANNGVGDAQEWLTTIYHEHQDYEAVSRCISIYSDKLSKNKLEPQTRKLLKTIIKIAKGEHSPFDKKFHNEVFLLSNTKKEPKQNLIQVENIDNENEEEFLSTASNYDDADNIFSAGVNSTQSFELQKLSIGSVLLSTIEQNQFLPWAWNTLNKYETQVILNEIPKLINSTSIELKMTGAIIWIALKIGRSIRRVLDLPIDGSPQSEWTLNLQDMQLQRFPPRRKSSWIPSDAVSSWIQASSELNCIHIPEEIQTILESCFTLNINAEVFWQLWKATNNSNPLKFVHDYLVNLLPRYSHGKLSQVLSNQLFLKSMDYKFARISSSHPLTGLPPACAYASWTNLMPFVKEIAEFSPDISMHANNENEVVLFGALLNPIENLLIKEITSAATKVEAIRKSQNLIQYHNQFTGYIYLMLLASTGARPINDLFESITQFDFSKHFVFIDDKSVTYGNKGRLVPLPIKLSNYINTQYRAHLRLVAETISQTNNNLSFEINQIVEGKTSNRLPFLFLLSTEDLGGWKSISGSEFRALRLFETPLPLNLFRHRLAKYLARNHVDSEIIDGLFGHVEYGSESYGEFSERVWADDILQIRSYIESAFDALQFSYISHQPLLISKNKIPNGLHQENISFGSRVRAINRSNRVKNAIRVVKDEIKDYLKGRSFDELEETELKILSEKMAVSPSGIPRHDALLRYHYFERAIEKFWKKSGKKILIKKRYIAPIANSPFNSSAPNAHFKINALRQIFYQILEKETANKLTVQDCAIYSILLLIFENKLTDIKKLTQIATGKHFRIILLNKKYYMDYSPKEVIDSPTQPVQRYSISPLVVSFLLKISNSTWLRANNSNSKLPKSLLFFLEEFNKLLGGVICHDVLSLITEIVKLINQINFMTTPGIVAGYLSGRSESWSLSLYDFVKLHTGKRVIFNHDENKLKVDGDIKPINEETLILTRNSATYEASDARLYLQKISRLLNDYDDNPNIVDSKRDFVNLLDKELIPYKEKVSVSLYLLGEWVKHLIEVYKRNKKEEYATSSVLRYFSALSSKFESLAYQVNILAMEEDEVTEFYRQILLSTNETARHYLSLRLYDFHRWAEQKFSLENPDWTELPVSIKDINVRPGIILENEYQQALVLLSKSSHDDKIYARSLACFLILVYRFGLRSLEALGLQRSDIRYFDGQLVLLVQNNKIRELKNKQSRRQVPLLFNLSLLENQLLDEYLAYQEASFANKEDTPLFFKDQYHLNKSERHYFKSHVLDIIKHVTGNSNTNIHHARHSAANQVSYHLHALELPGWKKLNNKNIPNVKENLLGFEQTSTRRTSWASARFMGHAIRETQYKSYIHYIDEWANLYCQPFDIKVLIIESCLVLSLDDLQQKAKLSTFLLEKVEFEFNTPNTNSLFIALRLICNGKTIESAACIMFMKKRVLENLTSFVRHISNVLRSINPNFNDGLGILTKVSESGLQRLYNCTIAHDADMNNQKIVQNNFLNIPIEQIKTMIGCNGQILMYQDNHFELVRAMLDFFGIPNSLFDIIKSNKSEDRFDNVAHQYEFKLISQSDMNAVGAYQLDPTWDANSHYHVEARCALAYKKNSTGFIRNRYELLIIFALFLSLHHLLREPDKKSQ